VSKAFCFNRRNLETFFGILKAELINCTVHCEASSV
jgi:hypothetical protein